MKKNLKRKKLETSGDLSGIRGDLSGVFGDLDSCEITDEDRKKAIYIEDLIKE